MSRSHLSKSCIFHLRYAWFNLREQFSDLGATLFSNALIPFFIWILSKLWERFNSAQGNFTIQEIVVYIGITELLYMTFIRTSSISRASDDFSIALARPRSWLVMSFSGIVGRATGGRIVMLAILLLTFPLLGAAGGDAWRSLLRLLLLLPWLAVLQGLFSLLFAVAQVLWHQTNYFLLPFNKIFLVLGGVWGPMVDFSEPWRSWLLPLFPSDLFFQPAYFCLKGHFYEITGTTWILRTGILALVLSIINFYFFRMARVRHQSFGG